jgi:hypothetical protein
MPTYRGTSPIELPGLQAVGLELLTADVQVALGDAGTQPKLTLQGDEGSFDVDYTNGALVVYENLKATSATAPQDVRIVDGGLDVTVQVQGVVNSTITVNGVTVSDGRAGRPGDVGGDGASRRAELILPPEYPMKDWLIATPLGEVDIQGIHAQTLAAASVKGNIVLAESRVHRARLVTGLGTIVGRNVFAAERALFESKSGDVTVEGGRAGKWVLSSAIGDITIRGTDGPIEARSAAGTVRHVDSTTGNV